MGDILMEEKPQSIWRNTLILFGTAALGTLICVLTLSVTIDSVCAREASEQIPPYPNSTVIRQSHTLFRPFGMGETVMVLETDDDQRDVLKWYTEIRQQAVSNYQGLSVLNFNVSPRESGDGARIVLTSDCAWR